MLLNRFETLTMNNPVRAAIQRHVEARRLREMGGELGGGAALEVGCGRGVGTKLVLDLFGASRVDAFDLDPEMIARAGSRLAKYGDRVRLWEGDVTRIDAADGHYDAVFDFGIIHHVPHWERALQEIHRVLVPGGRFYAEEVLEPFIVHPFWRRLFDHPQENRFDVPRFVGGLTDAGFEIRQTRGVGNWFAWFVADKPG